jgi:hypothetical protein
MKGLISCEPSTQRVSLRYMSSAAANTPFSESSANSGHAYRIMGRCQEQFSICRPLVHKRLEALLWMSSVCV